MLPAQSLIGGPGTLCSRVVTSVQRCAKVSAIDVTAQTFFERLYLVLGLAPIGALSQLSVCSHTPTVYSVANSQFPCNFFPKWPLIFFGQHNSPSNLAESRCPSPTYSVWALSLTRVTERAPHMPYGRVWACERSHKTCGVKMI